jgi:hypothetical protein
MNKLNVLLAAGAMVLGAVSEGCYSEQKCSVTPAHDAVSLHNVNDIQNYCAKWVGKARRIDCLGINSDDDMVSVSALCDDSDVVEKTSSALTVVADDDTGRTAVAGVCYGGGAKIDCSEK